MGKGRAYWYVAVLNMIKHYPDLKKDKSKRARAYSKAIDEAFEETLDSPDGDIKVKAIKLLYFTRKNVGETASMVYAGERTVKRWASAFVYLVGRKVGF